MNRMLCSVTDGRQYDDDLETFDDEPDASEMSVILEAIGWGEWADKGVYPDVQTAYTCAYEMNGEEMEEVFHRLRKEARDAAGDLLEALEDIGTPVFMKRGGW